MKQNKWRRILALVLFMALCVGSTIYLTAYYPAGENAMEALQNSEFVTITTDGTQTVFAPQNPEIGLIFYPGGKVEAAAYAPLLHSLADRGILCILIRMPCNLAFFQTNAAHGIPGAYPQVKTWLLGGHSLGGSAAAMCAASYPEEFDGLLLLGAYSSKNLHETDLQCLSLYGSEDGVMHRNFYEKCRDNLPECTQEIIIEGGCHAFFGDYGPQKGDGTPQITRDNQVNITVEAILNWIENF